MGNSLTNTHSHHEYFTLFEGVKRKGEDILLCKRTLPYGKLR